jgi:hypothetical protein
MFASVLDGECPDVGAVGQLIAKELCCLVQPSVALLFNHFRSVSDGLLHELSDVGLYLELVTRRIVSLAEVGPDV